MPTRADFARAIAKQGLSQVDLAIAFLWYYRHTQEYEERTASDLAADFQGEGFGKPNVTRLDDALKRSKQTVKGKRPRTFQINVRSVSELDDKYLSTLGEKKVPVTGAVLPPEMLAGTRLYLESMGRQINGAYDFAFYDACAVLCRRLMESLIIETYIQAGRHGDIQVPNTRVFKGLESLISYVASDKAIAFGRNTPSTMEEIKRLGDTAAHDRIYVTKQVDIDDVKAKYRKLIGELLHLSKLVT